MKIGYSSTENNRAVALSNEQAYISLPTRLVDYRTGATDPDNATASGFYYTSSLPASLGFEYNQGTMFVSSYSSSWVAQMVIGCYTDKLAFRKKGEIWSNWKIAATEDQLTNYLPLTGGQVSGPLTISAGGASSWTEGLRIAPASNGWTTLCLGSTASSGTGSGVWSMHTYQGTFYLAHNGSSSGTPLLRGLANNGFDISGKLSVSDLLTATSGVKIGDKATIQYNATDDCIDISFA